MGISANVDEAKVLLASASANKKALNLNEFMDLIFS